MPTTDDQIINLWEARKRDPNEKWRREAERVKDLLNGDIWAPVTEKFGESEASSVANLAQNNMNQMAKRAASTQPNVRFMSIKPGQQLADSRARKRTLATVGWHDRNKMKLIDRKQMRELLGFGRRVTQIGPRSEYDRDFDAPKWMVRDPLTSYPAPSSFQDAMTPCDCIFAYRRSWAWVKAYYPDVVNQVATQYSRNLNNKLSNDTLFQLLEYIDDEERILLLINQESQNTTFNNQTPQGIVMRLMQIENRLGQCPVVSPSLITIDRLVSPYIGNYGMYIMRNKLAALDYEYAERTVFPERYFVEPAGSAQGDIIQQARPREGQLGWVRGGDFHDMMPQPNFNATQTIDRLSEEERTSNSTPAEFTGQSAENIRTGARGQQVSSAAIDFTIQELQEITEMAKESENRLAVKVYKTYINKPSTYYIGDTGAQEQYSPTDFESDENHVFYSAAGADVNQLVVSGGQRIAQKTMSRETFMSIDPLVEDVEAEMERIQSEALREAGFSQLMQPGVIDPVALASVASKIADGDLEWWDAMVEVQKERQQAQASSGPPGAPDGPVAPGSPEAQPGLAPGAAQPAIAGPSGDQMNLSNLLSSLRRPQQPGPSGA